MLSLKITQIATITVVMLVLDIVWLTATAASSRQLIAAIQGKPLQIRWLPAVAVYILMIGAVWFFAVEPSTTWYGAAGRGALLGAAMYGVYELTNHASLISYPLQFAVRDIAWGAYLCAAAAAAAVVITKLSYGLN